MGNPISVEAVCNLHIKISCIALILSRAHLPSTDICVAGVSRSPIQLEQSPTFLVAEGNCTVMSCMSFVRCTWHPSRLVSCSPNARSSQSLRMAHRGRGRTAHRAYRSLHPKVPQSHQTHPSAKSHGKSSRPNSSRMLLQSANRTPAPNPPNHLPHVLPPMLPLHPLSQSAPKSPSLPLVVREMRHALELQSNQAV